MSFVIELLQHERLSLEEAAARLGSAGGVRAAKRGASPYSAAVRSAIMS